MKSKVTLSTELEKCKDILENLLSDPLLEAFYEPVQWKELGLLTYPRIIKKPMDLTTVKTKLMSGKYASSRDFEKDIHLIWNNCMLFNSDDSDLFEVASRTAKAFDKLFKKALKGMIVSKKRKSVSGKVSKAKRKGVSIEQKAKFCQTLYNLTEIELGQVISELNKICPRSIKKNWKNEEADYGEEELRIDLDLIDTTSFQKIHASLNKALTEKEAKEKSSTS